MTERSTRGKGIFEPWLAEQRYQQARRALRQYCPEARSVLDIGCGGVPLFLRSLQVPHRYGLDKTVTTARNDNGIIISHWEAHDTAELPFAPGSFDIITMLAVWEHIREPALRLLIKSCHTCLRSGGALIVTTPSPIGQMILQPMAWLGLVSKEEIEEHVSVMSIGRIQKLLREEGFTGVIHGRRFLLGFNQLIVALRP